MKRTPKRSRLAATVLGAAALLCLCGIGGGGIALSAVSSRAKGLPTAYEQARQAGLAVTVADLKRDVDPASDAYPAVERARDRFRAMPEGTVGEMYELGDAVLSFEALSWQKDRVGELIRDAAPALGELRKAGERPRMSVPEPEIRYDSRKLTVGEALGLGVLLFSADALLAGESQDLDRAREALVAGRALLRHLEAESSYLAFRRRAWAEIRLQRALVRVFQENPGNPEALSLLRDFQRGLGPLPSVREAIAGDLALALDAISRRKEEDVEQLPFADAFKDMGRADVVGIFTRAVQALPRESDDVATLDRVLARMDEEAVDAPIYGGYARGYRAILSSLKDVITRRRLAANALAIGEAIARGDTPTKLPDLGENSVDPHVNHPFRFRKDEDQIVVYSVGRDTLDDGGLERPPRRLGVQTRDVVFAIPLPRP